MVFEFRQCPEYYPAGQFHHLLEVPHMKTMSLRGSIALSTLAIAGALAVPECGNAQAITFRFADTSNNFMNSFNINGVGSTVSIRVFVEQSGGNPLGSDGGLTSLGMRFRFDNPIGSGTPNTFFDVVDRGVPPSNFGMDIVPNVPPGGFSTINGGTLTSVVINTSSSFTTGIMPDAQGRILIGLIRVTGLAQGTAAIRAEDPMNPGQQGGNFTTFNNFIGLDSLLVSGNATITVVPEPTSLALVGLVCAGATLYRFQRRNRRVSSTIEQSA
jgi:hypothetical protein